MKTRTFLAFVAPSVLAMVTLIFLPLIGVVWIAVHNSYVERAMVEVTTEVPLFGGKTRIGTTMQPQPLLDADGRPVIVWEYVGAEKLVQAAELSAVSGAVTRDCAAVPFWQAVRDMYAEVTNLEFWGALEFTLIYTFVTTPFVLVFGFGLALAVNRVTRALKGALIFVTLLPMVITPVIAALSIYWLFIDNAVVSALLRQLGFGQFYFTQSALSIRALIIAFGIWNATPFAFIVLYAGLQTVPKDTVEAARIDGAGRWQTIRLVVIPHLAPLFALITLILMDEPLSNLDAKLRVSTRAQIKNLSHELQVTTIYVTHDQIEAMTLADRVVVMKKGRIQQVGTPTEIYDRPANTFVAGFIGNPAMNLIDGRVEGGVFVADLVRVPGLSVPDGPATLGFRAEDARVAAAGQITAPVYTMELLGDATMLTIRAGGALVAVKAGKAFRADIGTPVAIHVPATAIRLFDAVTGMRID